MLSTFWSQLWVKAGISFPLRIPRLTDGDKELVLLSSAHCRVLHITRGRHSMFSTTHSTMVYVTHVERRPPVSGRACSPACHPERSEGSRSPDVEILRCAQDDRPSLHMSGYMFRNLKAQQKYGIVVKPTTNSSMLLPQISNTCRKGYYEQ